MKKLSRLESNKETRRVLNKHGVDLSYTQYSCCGMDIRLSGWLCKHDGSDFNGPQIEALIHDFQRFLNGYTISGEFDNWNFTTERISYLGERDSKGSGSYGEEQTLYDIDIDDYDIKIS